MKLKKSLFIIMIISVFSIVLCSCSQNMMRKGTEMKNDAKRGINNAIRNGENVVDYGLGALDNSMGGDRDVTGNRYYRGGMGMNDGFGTTYGANSGYSSYVGNGTSTSVSGTDDGMEIFPTIRDTSRDNFGQVNTTNGSADGGKGDIYDDMNMNRNSLRTDKFNKKYVR